MCFWSIWTDTFWLTEQIIHLLLVSIITYSKQLYFQRNFEVQWSNLPSMVRNLQHLSKIESVMAVWRSIRGTFYTFHATVFGLPQPAARRGRASTAPVFLPASEGYNTVHCKYVVACVASGKQAAKIPLLTVCATYPIHKILWSYSCWYVTWCLAWVANASISSLTKNLQLPKEYKISLCLLQFLHLKPDLKDFIICELLIAIKTAPTPLSHVVSHKSSVITHIRNHKFVSVTLSIKCTGCCFGFGICSSKLIFIRIWWRQVFTYM